MSSTSAPDPAALPPPAAAAFRPWSLAARLTVWYVGSAFALVLCATGFLYWVLYTNLDREDDQFLADKVHILRALLRERPDDIKSIKREAEEEWAGRQVAQIAQPSGLSTLPQPGAGLAPGRTTPERSP